MRPGQEGVRGTDRISEKRRRLREGVCVRGVSVAEGGVINACAVVVKVGRLKAQIEGVKWVALTHIHIQSERYACKRKKRTQ